jgi:hypothetical protein
LKAKCRRGRTRPKWKQKVRKDAIQEGRTCEEIEEELEKRVTD